MIRRLFTFEKSFLSVYPVYWLLLMTLLIGLDIGSKYWVTSHLNFPKWNRHGLIEVDGHPTPPATFDKARKINILGENGQLFKLRLVFNDKFIFGLGPDFAQGHGMMLSYGFTFCAIVLLWLYHWKNPELGSSIAWLFVFSGALGNLVDKLFLKSVITREWTFSLYPKAGHVNGVVDFLESVWFGWEDAPVGFLQWDTWPSFNLADSFIVTGMLFLFLTIKESKTRNKEIN